MDQFLKKNTTQIYINNNILVEDETLLLIVDVQQKLLKNIKDNKLLVFNIKKLINTCNLLNVQIAITEQNPLKLGKTLESIIDDNEYPIFEKMEFSCIKNKSFINYLNEHNFNNIIVCGIESHICVLQTSIDLLQKGLNILIPRDAIGSRRLILSGAVASTTESLICELCKTSNRKEFREVSKILKDSFSN